MKYDPSSEDHRVTLAIKLEEVLRKANFQNESKPGCNEEVYTYTVPQVTGVKIYVYSSIVRNMVTKVPQVRGLGADAIKISVVYHRKDGRVKQLFKTTTVNRTGEFDEIPQRLLRNMRDAYSTLRERSLNRYTCRCGAPMFDAKSGDRYCAATCWVK